MSEKKSRNIKEPKTKAIAKPRTKKEVGSETIRKKAIKNLKCFMTQFEAHEVTSQLEINDLSSFADYPNNKTSKNKQGESKAQILPKKSAPELKKSMSQISYSDNGLKSQIITDCGANGFVEYLELPSVFQQYNNFRFEPPFNPFIQESNEQPLFQCASILDKSESCNFYTPTTHSVQPSFMDEQQGCEEVIQNFLDRQVEIPLIPFEFVNFSDPDMGSFVMLRKLI